MATKQDYNFAQNIPQDYKCMICLDVLQEPQLTDCCGQHFCKACLERAFNGNTNPNLTRFEAFTGPRLRGVPPSPWNQPRQLPVLFQPQQMNNTSFLRRIDGSDAPSIFEPAVKQCPHCKANKFNYMIDMPVERKISDLKVYCPYKGCTATVRRGDIETHKQKCDYATVMCTNNCGEQLLQKDLQSHLTNSCNRRNGQCQYCWQIIMYCQYNLHITQCPEYPIPCDNRCETINIKRNKMGEHKSVCPLEPVKCPYQDVGCQEKITRKDLGSHVANNTQQHLAQLMSAHMQLMSDHRKLLTDHTKLKSEFENYKSSNTITKSVNWMGITKAPVNVHPFHGPTPISVYDSDEDEYDPQYEYDQDYYNRLDDYNI